MGDSGRAIKVGGRGVMPSPAEIRLTGRYIYIERDFFLLREKYHDVKLFV